MKKKAKENRRINYVKVILIIIITLFALITGYMVLTLLTGRWTEKKKQEFALNCSLTESIDGLGISFTGFSYDEIERVLVKRIHQGQPIDSFYISPREDSYDKLRSRYWASIDTIIYIRDTYQICLPQHQHFVLSDMKMGMWPTFTMFSENYACVMHEYCIDGEEFEDSSCPDFVKPGFKFPWEETQRDSVGGDGIVLESEIINE